MNEDDSTVDSDTFKDPLSDYEPVEYESELHRAMAEETADSIAFKPVIQVGPTTSIRQAIEVLRESQVSSLLVVDQEEVVGIFTERDVLERVAEQYSQLEYHPVEEVMTTHPTVVYETDPAAAALAAIALAGHRHVPILSLEGKLHGILSPRRLFDFVEAHDLG